MENALGSDVAYLRRMAQAGRAGPPLGGLLMAAFGGYIGAGALVMWLRANSLPAGFTGMEFIAGLAVFALVVGGPTEVSRKRLVIALAASIGAMFVLLASYILSLWVTAAIVRADPEAWRTTLLSRYWRFYFFIPFITVLSVVVAPWVILARLRRHPAAIAPGNAVAGALWSGGMIAMAAIIGVFVAQGATLREKLFSGGAAEMPDIVVQAARGAAQMAIISTLPAMFWIVWALAWWVWGLASGRRWALLVAAGAVAVAIWYAATMAIFPTSVAGLFLLAFVPGLLMIREARAPRDGTPA